jgi:hypothetical protein
MALPMKAEFSPPRLVITEAEDNSGAEPYVVLPAVVVAAIAKLRIKVIGLQKANAEELIELQVGAAAGGKHESVVGAQGS